MVKRNAEKLRSPHYKVADIGLEIDLHLLRDVSYTETVNESFTEFFHRINQITMSLWHILLHIFAA